MKQDRLDPAHDPLMSRAILAATGQSPRDAAGVAALEERIARAARPYLDARRGAHANWMDYAASWSRTIVPIGIATALVAASCLVWLSITPRRQSAGTVEHVAMLGAATNAVSSGDLVDLAISDVDMPAPTRADRRDRAR